MFFFLVFLVLVFLLSRIGFSGFFQDWFFFVFPGLFFFFVCGVFPGLFFFGFCRIGFLVFGELVLFAG